MGKKILKLIMIVIVSISIISAIIILLINWKSIEGEWIGFWGSIIGSILGGVVTLVALRKTIKSETIARNEDRRLQVIPYLQYNIIQDNIIQEELKSKLWSYILLQPNSKIVEEVIKPGTEYKIDLNFCMVIENVGMNSAVNLSILEIKYCGITDYSYIDYKIMKVGEKIHLNFAVLVNYNGKLNINKESCGSTPIRIKLAYTDLLENYYEQDIVLGCYWSAIQYIDEETNVKIDIEYNYYVSHGIKDISSPRYIKGKNIMYERDKKIKMFNPKNKYIRKIISKIKK